MLINLFYYLIVQLLRGKLEHGQQNLFSKLVKNNLTTLKNDYKSSSPSMITFDMTPFYWVILTIGGCIAITLTYVSWKKYHFEKKKNKERKR